MTEEMIDEKGLFIVLEGIDGSGTTTQARALAERLKEEGHDVVVTCQPSEGPIGKLTREHLRADIEPLDARALALLFAADRLDHLHRVMIPAIRAGKIVICDRYVMSAWAYQSIDCDLKWVREINTWAGWPDITFYIDLPLDEANRRVCERKGIPEERFDGLEIQQLVQTNYDVAVTWASARRGETIIKIDGDQSADDVTRDLYLAVKKHWTGHA